MTKDTVLQKIKLDAKKTVFGDGKDFSELIDLWSKYFVLTFKDKIEKSYNKE